MADATASWTMTLDSSSVRSGAQSAMSSLDKLRLRIQTLTKSLAGYKQAQSQLAQSESVKAYEKRAAAIKRNESFETKAAKTAADASAKREAAEKLATAQMIEAQSGIKIDPAAMSELQKAATALGVTADDAVRLAQEADKAESKLAGVRAELETLNAAQNKAAKEDATVSAWLDQGKAIKATEAELSQLQTEYARAGGDASKLADKVEEPTGAIGKLLEQAKASGGPLGSLASKIEGIGSAAKMAGPLALLAVIIAIGVAAIKTGYALAKMALEGANAARDAARARSNAAFGSSDGVKEIEGAMKALRAQTALSKSEAQGLAIELKRGGEAAQYIDDTAVTIGRFAQLGDDAASSIKGIYEELRKPAPPGALGNRMQLSRDSLPRDVYLELAKTLGHDAQKALQYGFISEDKGRIREALKRIGEQKFAGSALEQMRSLDKLGERLRENLDSLFSKVKVGVLLGALQKLVGLLDETSESGKAIRDVLGAFAQPLADAIEAALPYVEAFLEGIIYTGLVVVLMALKMKNALSGLIPDSLTKNIDWLEVAFWTGAIAMGIFTAAAATLAIVLLALATPFLLIVALIALIVVGIVMAIDAIVGFADEVSAALDGVDFTSIATGIIDGLIKGLADGAASLYAAFADLAKGGYKAFKDAILMRSPPKLYVMAGKAIPNAVAMGVESEADKADNAVSEMLSPPSIEPSGGKAQGGSNGKGITLVMQAGAVVLNGVAMTEETVVAIFRRGLEIIAAEGGAAVEAPS